jgi:gliding motility-associated peptidyl-prolyl isomerase
MNKILSIFFILTIISCSENTPRRPITESSGSEIKESVIRNKKRIKAEETLIDTLIKREVGKTFIPSGMGYKYAIITKNTKDSLKPKFGDICYFEYEVRNLKNQIIYSKQELQPQVYVMDKQLLMTGLRDGLKRMKKKETAIFYFPSHIAYGYHGDEKKIAPNTPLICEVTLIDFKTKILDK